MEDIYMAPLMEMGVALTELAAKGTASSVNKKVRAIKDEKNAEKLRVRYDEILNEVLQEREEAVRIAQVYKAELDRMVISDEDIEHLHNTVTRVLDLIGSYTGNQGEDNVIKSNNFEQIKELINVDTLKTMQLLGFNYKVAIGEPLTKLCAEAISNLGNRRKKGK